MSITSAMYTGISGLSANGEAISVLGNNIANVNTTGFKSGRMLFSDVLSSSIGNNSQIGRGVQIQAVQNNFSQGSFETTENVTDLAIQGDSFFIVKNPGEAQRYTRAGAFSFDKDKILVNPDGYEVMGYGINQTTGLNNGVLGNINLSASSSLSPSATSTVGMVLNLDSTAATGSTFNNAISMYDSLGNPHTVNFTYTKQAPTATGTVWNWASTVDGAAGPTGTLTFDLTGGLTAQTPLASAAQNVALPPTGVTTPQPIAFNFSGSTQFASSSVVNSQTQNGYPPGSLAKIQVDDKGYVVGVYSNGQSQKIAQIALARFSSPLGLSKVGGTLFEETLSSGQSMITDASTPGVGKILSNSLEQSNVDMAAQFVKLIQAQRAFSANSKTITTADEMTQELLTLKR